MLLVAVAAACCLLPVVVAAAAATGHMLAMRHPQDATAGSPNLAAAATVK